MSRVQKRAVLIVTALTGLLLFIVLNFASSGETADGFDPAGDPSTRASAERAALAFAERHFGPGDWRAFAMYDANAAATGYVSKEKPDADPAVVWPRAPFEYFRVIAGIPGEGRLTVYVSSSDSRVIGWNAENLDRETGAVPFPSAEEAMEALGYDPADFAAAGFDGETFSYVHREQVGDLGYRVDVFMPEGRVLAVEPAVEAPASIVRLLGDYELKAALFSLLILFLQFLLAVAAVVAACVLRAQAGFGRGVFLSLACFVLLAVHTVNQYPAQRLQIDDTPALVIAGLFGQGVNMLMAASVWISLVAGDALWRRMGFRPWPGLREPDFPAAAARSVWLGALYAFIILGLQAVVLQAGFSLFGVWTTADPSIDPRNMLAPGLYPLLAWVAAVSEEAVFRLFAIAAFTAAFRPLWRWVHRLTDQPAFLSPLFSVAPAAFLASVLWGAAHIGYAVYPVPVRLIEVTLLGLVFSWLFVRHGLMAAIFAHAFVDLILMALDAAGRGLLHPVPALAYLLMPVLAGYGASLLSARLAARRAPAGSLER